MSLVIECTGCGRKSKYSENMIDKQAACPYCHRRLVIMTLSPADEPKHSMRNVLLLLVAVAVTGVMGLLGAMELKKILQRPIKPVQTAVEQVDQNSTQKTKAPITVPASDISLPPEPLPDSVPSQTIAKPHIKAIQKLSAPMSVEELPVEAVTPKVQPEDIPEVSIAELVAAYKNQLKGQAQYGGKLVKVTGKFNCVPNQQHLTDPANANASVRCGMYSGNILGSYFMTRMLAIPGIQYNPGQVLVFTVTVTGECGGPESPNCIKLNDCKLLTSDEEIRNQLEINNQHQLKANQAYAARLEKELKGAKVVLKPDKPLRPGYAVEVVGKMKGLRIIQNVLVLEIAINGTPRSAFCSFYPFYKEQLESINEGETVIIRGKNQNSTSVRDPVHLLECILIK